VDKDYYDGLLDITHASDHVTVSWSKFSDHWKGSLIGHSDSNSAEDTGKLHVTYHHNHWNNVNSRLPSLRFGTGHIFSSCFENTPTSGVNVRMGAHVLVEESHFRNVTLPIVTNLSSKVEGTATSKNNIFEGGEARITKPAAISIPYKYTLVFELSTIRHFTHPILVQIRRRKFAIFSKPKPVLEKSKQGVDISDHGQPPIWHMKVRK
jgi:pectate lyase